MPNFFDRFSKLREPFLKNEPKPVEKLPAINLDIPKVKLEKDMKDITLADYTPGVKELIKVHKLENYRRKRDEMKMMPDIRIELDMFFEGEDDDL